jgi:hypothetical protein
MDESTNEAMFIEANGRQLVVGRSDGTITRETLTDQAMPMAEQLGLLWGLNRVADNIWHHDNFDPEIFWPDTDNNN